MFLFLKEKNNNKKEKGFVILIAVLLSGLFVIIGSSIFNIALKELILTSGARESQFAFYSADAGMECALYWDLNGGGVFATSTYSTNVPDLGTLYCASQDIMTSDDWAWKTEATETSAQTIFSFNIFPDDSSRSDCVKVVVTKELVDSRITTKIESRGYNTCDIENPRRVERGFRATY